MACAKCGGKGYIEDWYHYGDQARPMIRQCCDVTAYSRRVQMKTLTREEIFKVEGKESPFIGHHLTVTHQGLQVRPPSNDVKGEPCPVVPIRRK